MKFILTLLVVLSAAILPFFIKSRLFRWIQLALNVIVLGFWSGSFISYSLLVNYMANGVSWIYSLIPLLLLIIAFIYPLFNKKSYYCTWVCPYGSLQELAGKSIKYKFKISPSVLKGLNILRQVIWAFLMLLMWSGVMFKWMDYEPFAAFLFGNASIVAIIIALIFLILSFFVNRPYCRFVCPTGTLFKISQNTND